MITYTVSQTHIRGRFRKNSRAEVQVCLETRAGWSTSSQMTGALEENGWSLVPQEFQIRLRANFRPRRRRHTNGE